MISTSKPCSLKKPWSSPAWMMATDGDVKTPTEIGMSPPSDFCTAGAAELPSTEPPAQPARLSARAAVTPAMRSLCADDIVDLFFESGPAEPVRVSTRYYR